MTVFHSTKHALACAGKSLRGEQLGWPDSKLESWCPRCAIFNCGEPEHETVYRKREGQRQELDLAEAGLLARAAMVAVGKALAKKARKPDITEAERARMFALAADLDPQSQLARTMYAWAETTDMPHPDQLEAEADELADANPRDPAVQQRREQAASLRRVLEAQQLVYEHLLAEGLIRKKPKLELKPLAEERYRVIAYQDGRRARVLEHDSRAGGLTAAEAQRVMQGRATGELEARGVYQLLDPGPEVREPGLRYRLLPRWDPGRFPTFEVDEAERFAELAELDEAICEAKGCSPATARRIRRTWGVEGHRGRTPTRAPWRTEA